MIRINAAGTTASQFSIGKDGPTIYEGSGAPGAGNGAVGDVYLCTAASPVLYVKTSAGWVPSADFAFACIVQAITSSPATIAAATSYAGVNVASAATLTLPTGTTGKRLLIKDESGNAGTNLITVAAAGVQTIDGQSTWVIDVNYGVIELVYGSTQWHIVGGVFSGLFNQLKL